jgi:hypothetical protein
MANLAPEPTAETVMATQSTASRPLKTFTVFPNLPYELRSEIWRQGAEGATPRIVEFIIPSNNSKLKCRTSSPAVLSICHDSRKAALKVFEELCYEGEWTGAMINWKRDTLYLNTDIEAAKRLLTSPKQFDLMQNCRLLAMNRICFYGAVLAVNGYRRVRKFKNIEELTVVINKDPIGGRPPERTSVRFAATDARRDKTYERTGDHLAYALWKLPHVQRGVLVEEVEASEVSLQVTMSITRGRANESSLQSAVKPEAQEVPGSVYRQPATTHIGLLTKGSTAELCASTSM